MVSLWVDGQTALEKRHLWHLQKHSCINSYYRCIIITTYELRVRPSLCVLGHIPFKATITDNQGGHTKNQPKKTTQGFF